MSHSKTTFSDLELAQLDSVFESVCSKVKPVGDLDEDTKVAIRRRLFVLACNGMWDDLAALRDHLVLNLFGRRPETLLERSLRGALPYVTQTNVGNGR